MHRIKFHIVLLKIR